MKGGTEKMRGLLVKDFHLLFQRKQSIVIFIAICILMGFSSEGSFVVGYMSFLSAIFALSTISYDDADNGMLFLMTLPVERSTYARSKYVLGALFCVPAWILSVVLMLILSVVRGVPADLGNDIANAVIMLPLCVFVLDLMIPLQLKYGAEKSRIVLFVVWGGLFAIIFIISKAFGNSEAVSALVSVLDRIPLGAVIAALAVLCVVLTVISVKCSEKIMAKKTF